MKLARGFCDLNISATDTDLRQTVLKALSLGYQTVAINRDVTDPALADLEGKKKRKGDYSSIPPPTELTLTPDDLQRHGITREPVILTRLTVTYASPESPFLSKHKDVIKQYDLVAVKPITDKALKQTVSQSSVEADILALSIEERGTRLARRMLRMAKERNMYFELSYSPCLKEGTSRQQTIALAHSLHQSLRSANVVVTSQARLPNQLRQPYDIVNLGRFFGMTEAGAKAAVATTAHDLVYCAAMRRSGMSKCAAQITLLQGNSGVVVDDDVSDDDDDGGGHGGGGGRGGGGRGRGGGGRGHGGGGRGGGGGGGAAGKGGKPKGKDGWPKGKDGKAKGKDGRGRGRFGRKRRRAEGKFEGLNNARKYLKTGDA